MKQEKLQRENACKKASCEFCHPGKDYCTSENLIGMASGE